MASLKPYFFTLKSLPPFSTTDVTKLREVFGYPIFPKIFFWIKKLFINRHSTCKFIFKVKKIIFDHLKTSTISHDRRHRQRLYITDTCTYGVPIFMLRLSSC